jgi:hypothetical protein
MFYNADEFTKFYFIEMSGLPKIWIRKQRRQ